MLGKLKLLISSGCCNENIKETVIFANSSGFDGIELMNSSINRTPNLLWLKSLLSNYDQKVYSVHMPLFTKYLSRYLIQPKKISNLMVEHTLDLAKSLEAKQIVIHPFPAIFFKERMKKHMKMVVNRFRGEGIRLTIENLERQKKLFSFEPYCLSDYDQLYNFVNEEDCYLTLDVAHCVSKNISPLAFFDKYKDRIANIHVSDGKGFKTHLPLERGILNFKTILGHIKRAGYEGYLTLEINPYGGAEIKRSKELIDNYLNI